MFDLATLLQSTRGHVARGDGRADIVFRSGCFDSRQAASDSLFFALRGERDGHDFVADALARGARAAVVARIPEGVPQDALLVIVADPLRALRDLADALRSRQPIPAIGITGSMGKTTTKEAAAAALGARYRVLRSAASFNNEIGVPITFLSQEPSHEVAVVEMGFYVPGEIADLCRLVRPRVGIVTAVPDRPPHFSRTPSVEAIARGKAELVESLPPDGVALLNADDARVRAMASLTKARVVRFGMAEDAELRASDVAVDDLEATRFVAHHEGASAPVRFPLPGAHLVSNVLAALGAAVALGVPLDEAAVAVSTLEPPRHRMSVRRSGGITVIDDSYNASPAAVMAALALLGAQRGRRVAVLGDMLELGTLAADAHRDVGVAAASSADVLIGVGELAGAAVNEAKRRGIREAHSVVDSAEALMLLRRTLRAGDVVLVKGSRALKLDEVVDAILASPAAS